jgi:hypothetical protein
MITTDTETALIERAVRAMETETGLRVRVVKREYVDGKKRIDALLQIDDPEQLELRAEVKAWAQHINTGALIEQVRQLGRNGILVTDYVNPKLADRLRQNNTQFMDACGNAFIQAPRIHVFVKGMKRTETNYLPEDRKNRAFNTTGLKVTYALLCNPNMVNAPYRDIAEKGGVALGTVGWVMQDLKRAGFLVKRGGDRALRNYEKLLQRWVEAYPEKLKPKILIGWFLAENPDWWKDIPINEFGAQWGGEIAAAKYTNYLRPEIATIYAADTTQLAELLRAARLRRLEEGKTTRGMKVCIYNTFWKLGKEHQDLVDPALVYADLIATGDPRNREVAQEIYGKYITERIREN